MRPDREAAAQTEEPSRSKLIDVLGLEQLGFEILCQIDPPSVSTIDLKTFEMRTVRLHSGTAAHEPANHRTGRSLPVVSDIGLVRETEHQNLGVLDRLLHLVQLALHSSDDVRRQAIADVLGQLDELELLAERANASQQTVGGDANAMPADTRARVKRSKPKRLSRRGPQGLPDVDTQVV